MSLDKDSCGCVASWHAQALSLICSLSFLYFCSPQVLSQLEGRIQPTPPPSRNHSESCSDLDFYSISWFGCSLCTGLAHRIPPPLLDDSEAEVRVILCPPLYVLLTDHFKVMENDRENANVMEI